MRVVLFTGKGGVGKTTVAAATAVRAARGGHRTLVMSTDPAHSLADSFEVEIGSSPVEITDRLRAVQIDAQERLEENWREIQDYFIQLMNWAGTETIQAEELTVIPGLDEIFALIDVKTYVESGDYDMLVVDCAPTAETLRLLSLPEIMAAWTDGLLRHRERSDHMSEVIGRMTPQRSSGDDLSHFQEHSEADAGEDRFSQIRSTLLRRRRLFHRARRLLLDEQTTAFVLVLIPERLPVLETAKAVEALRRFQIPIAGLVVNRVLPAGPLGPFLEERRVQERQYLDQIHERFAALPSVEVPLYARDVGGLEALRAVGSHLFPDPA
jgi:arsenite-transporting ATPase